MLIKYKTPKNVDINFVLLKILQNNLAIPLKNKNTQTITNEISIVLTKWNRKSNNLESERAAELYNSFFQNFLEVKNIQN